MLRGFAALTVAWHHALETSLGIGYARVPANWLVLVGAAGVDIFFVISGFIMVFICARGGQHGRPGASARFLANRARRIYPLYWVCCSCFLTAMALGFFDEKVLSPGDILASLALWPTHARIVGISWTLSFEIYFYLIYALALRARNLSESVLIAAGLIVTMILFSRLLGGPDLFTASPIAIEFVYGMGIALAYVNGPSWFRSLSPAIWVALGGTGIVCASIAFYAGTTHGLPAELRFVVWGLPAALLVVAALGHPHAAPPDRADVSGQSSGAAQGLKRLGVALGDASYATYLFHPLVLIVYAKAFELVPALTLVSQWIWVPFITLVCGVAGYAMHRSVERPLMQWFAGRARQRSALA